MTQPHEFDRPTFYVLCDKLNEEYKLLLLNDVDKSEARLMAVDKLIWMVKKVGLRWTDAKINEEDVNLCK